MHKKILLYGVITMLVLALVACGTPAQNISETALQGEQVTTAQSESISQTTLPTTSEEVIVDDKKALKIATLKGPTGMGMVQLMENAELGSSTIDYQFEIVGAPDQIIGQVVQGKVDVAAVPTNMAAILNVKTEGKVQLLGVNTLGVLFIVENGNLVKTVEDLADKTILSSGKGAAPEYVLDYILQENNLRDKVKIEYATEHTEVATKLNSGDATLAVLPQPFVTSTLLSNKNAQIAINLTKAWQDVTEGAVLPMGSVIVNRAYAEENPDVIESFMKEYVESVKYVNEQPEAAGKLIEKFGILPKATLATKAIPHCNITLIPAKDAQPSLVKFYEILHGFNPKSVGGKLPEDDFYYGD